MKKIMLDDYSIDMDEQIQDFVQLFNEFRNHGYDPTKIIGEYTMALSLRDEAITNQSRIQAQQKQITVLGNNALSLESQVGMHRLTLDTYYQLESMGFGLKELNLLWNTILEIARSNNIPSDQAVSKFISDVEEQYDSKLGFEDKVDVKRRELAQLNNEVNHNRLTITITPFIGTILHSLFQKGVGEQEILIVPRFIHDYANGKFHSAECTSGKYNNMGDLLDKTSNKSDIWKQLIGELKEYGGLKSAIAHKSRKLDSMLKKIEDSKRQKQALLDYVNLVVSFYNALNVKMSCFKWLVDNIDKGVAYRNGILLQYIVICIFF
jgi:hypothetical protein